MELKQLISSLRRRAKSLTNISILVLLLTASIMLCAGWLFFNAADIAAKDIQAPDPGAFKEELEKLTAEANSYRKFTPSDALTIDIKNFRSASDNLMNELSNKSGIDFRISHSNLFSRNDKNKTDSGYRFNPYNSNALINRLDFNFKLPDIPEGIILTIFEELYLLRNIEDSHFDELIEKININDPNIRNQIDSYLKFVAASENLQDQWTTEFNTQSDKFYSNQDRLVYLTDRIDELEKITVIATNYKLAAKYGIELADNSKNGATKDNQSELYFLLSTNVIRFGPLIIIFFFSSVLINLYRYCIRLSAYYHARADALELLSEDIDCERFNLLTDALSPESYDLGKIPKSPMDQAIEIAKLIKK